MTTRERDRLLYAIAAVSVGLLAAGGYVAAVTLLNDSPRANWFTGSLSTTGAAGCSSCGSPPSPSVTLPEGADVNLTWVDTSGGNVAFFVTDPLGLTENCPPDTLAYTEFGSVGGCSFLTLEGHYEFSALGPSIEGPQTVRFVGQY